MKSALNVNPQHAESLMEVFCVYRENLGQWEKISRGEAEDIVPSRPCDSGPVKVDNWQPKGVAGPPKEYNLNPATDLELCRGKNLHPVLAGDGSAKGDLTLKTHSYLIGWRRCQHWRFHRSQRLTDSRWGGTSTHHPTSTQLGNSFGWMDLCRFGCFYFGGFMLFYDLFLFLFELILLWSCICRGLTLNLSQARICEILLSVQAFLKWYCLPSVVGLSYAHYFSKVFPETEGMCRAEVWCNATLLRRWMSECFLLFFEQKSFAVLE